MKTVKSSIKNESEDLKILKAAITATATYINQWTEHEVNALSVKDKMPYIYPIDNLGFIIGHYRVLNHNGEWQVRTYDNLVHTFTEKLSAIFYVLCELTRRYKLSNNLLMADSNVGRLRNDVVHYENSVRKSKVNKDYVSSDIWVARLTEANLQLRIANAELKKSLNTAKYIKYWE
jgi:hypothetical protein